MPNQFTILKISALDKLSVHSHEPDRTSALKHIFPAPWNSIRNKQSDDSNLTSEQTVRKAELNVGSGVCWVFPQPVPVPVTELSI